MGIQSTKLTPGRQWADSPFQLLETPRKKAGLIDVKKETPASASATEMVLVHNMIIRGINSIYLQAPNVKLEKDIEDFLTYMYSWSLLVHMHHDNEESAIFPLLEEYIGIKGYMEKNVDQHKGFGPGLKAYDDYIPAVREGKEKFDGTKVRSIIDSFGQVLVQHLSEEIGTFQELDKFTDQIDWKEYNKKVQAKVIESGDTEHELPFGIVNMDVTFEGPIHKGTWPPMPWFVLLIFQWVHIPKHKSAWRFASCDSSGRPKDLPFVWLLAIINVDGILPVVCVPY